MKLMVNGSALDVPRDTSIAALLETMQLAGRRLAVEVNGEIVPRSTHAQATLRDGDQVEIVQAIGGG